jgi:hypothetical protein
MHKQLRFLPVLLLASVLPLVVFTGCDSSGSMDDDGGGGNGDTNAPPTANVSAPNDVDVGTQVTLDGSGSSDPDGDDLTFSWTLSAPSGSNATLSDASVEQPTFTPDVGGDYTAELEVSDGAASSTDSATITAMAQAIMIDSDITEDRTLTPDNMYVVTSTVCVESSSTLTVEDGVRIEFESGTDLKVCGDNSALVADGTEDNPISMTATDGNEQSGWWNGVGILSSNPNNSIDHAIIRHGGGEDLIFGSGDAANVTLRSGKELSLSNSEITDSGQHGVYCDENATPRSC